MYNNNPDIVEVTCYKSSHLKSPGTCYEYRRRHRRRRRRRRHRRLHRRRRRRRHRRRRHRRLHRRRRHRRRRHRHRRLHRRRRRRHRRLHRRRRHRHRRRRHRRRRHRRRHRHVIEQLTCFLHGIAEEMALNNNHSPVIGIISNTCNFHKLGKIKERFYKFYNFISVIRKSQ